MFQLPLWKQRPMKESFSWSDNPSRDMKFSSGPNRWSPTVFWRVSRQDTDLERQEQRKWTCIRSSEFLPGEGYAKEKVFYFQTNIHQRCVRNYVCRMKVFYLRMFFRKNNKKTRKWIEFFYVSIRSRSCLKCS